MIKTFTQDDVVRYIYEETSEKENAEMISAMLFDDELADTYASLKDILLSLDLATKEPSDKSIEAIISYSKSYHLHWAE